MSESPRFLSVSQVLRIHRRVIEEFGGDGSVRDQGLLESAILMPAAQFGGRYLHEGIAEMAAAYPFHVCRNHQFVDGNKRVALAAAEVFLDANGHRLAAQDIAVEKLTLGVAQGSLSKADVTAFFRRHVEGTA